MKNKLTIQEQIENLKGKGVQFNIMSEDEAANFLRYNNFFFKLKSYAKNYDTYQKPEQKGKYINLEFAYLVEISTLDMYLRKIIVHMCLDIEHFLKTELMYDISNNALEDGYTIIRKYLDTNYMVLSSLYQNAENSATKNLIVKFHEDEEEIPIWSFAETLSFGRFIELYDLLYGMYGGKNYSSYLGAVKYLRNIAAHNTCILNSLRKPYLKKINKTKDMMVRLAKIKELPNDYAKKMENPVIHDFVVMLFVYCDLLNHPSTREFRRNGMEQLENLFYNIMPMNSEYFTKNDVLLDNYKFICIILKYLKNLRNRQVLNAC